MDSVFRQEREETLLLNAPEPPTWETVAAAIAADIEAAEGREPVYPEIELGREYMLVADSVTPETDHADQYLSHVTGDGVTPAVEPTTRGGRRHRERCGDRGDLRKPHVGWELRPGGHAVIRLKRPVDGPLTALVATRSMPGRASIEITGPGGPVFQEIYLGSVISVPLGDGTRGTPAQARISVTDAADSVEGFVTSVLRGVASDDKDAHIVALNAANKALRQSWFIQSRSSPPMERTGRLAALLFFRGGRPCRCPRFQIGASVAEMWLSRCTPGPSMVSTASSKAHGPSEDIVTGLPDVDVGVSVMLVPCWRLPTEPEVHADAKG